MSLTKPLSFLFTSLLFLAAAASCSSSKGGGNAGGAGPYDDGGSATSESGLPNGCSALEIVTCAPGYLGSVGSALLGDGQSCNGGVCDDGSYCCTPGYAQCGSEAGGTGTFTVCRPPGATSCGNTFSPNGYCQGVSQCSAATALNPDGYGCCGDSPDSTCVVCDAKGKPPGACQCVVQTEAALCANGTCGSVDNCGTTVECPSCPFTYTCSGGKCVAPCTKCGGALQVAVEAAIQSGDGAGAIGSAYAVVCPGASTTLLSAALTCGCTACTAGPCAQPAPGPPWCGGLPSLSSGAYQSGECAECTLSVNGGAYAAGEGINTAECQDVLSACNSDGVDGPAPCGAACGAGATCEYETSATVAEPYCEVSCVPGSAIASIVPTYTDANCASMPCPGAASSCVTDDGGCENNVDGCQSPGGCDVEFDDQNCGVSAGATPCADAAAPSYSVTITCSGPADAGPADAGPPLCGSENGGGTACGAGATCDYEVEGLAAEQNFCVAVCIYGSTIVSAVAMYGTTPTPCPAAVTSCVGAASCSADFGVCGTPADSLTITCSGP